MMQGIIDLHHDIFFFLILILVFVSQVLVRALQAKAGLDRTVKQEPISILEGTLTRKKWGIFSNEYDKAPNSKYSVRGTELLFPGTILRLKTFFFSRNLQRSATKFQTSKPDVKPVSMSSPRSVDPGGKGNHPIVRDIFLSFGAHQVSRRLISRSTIIFLMNKKAALPKFR
ncbi:hypothetical protein RHGRI_001957 [Rhododendron griersonianum]|uniref:Cytochrome c oxidase subunit 2 n=1 Tax=Rhododendron griersonianum TaxID=479676 RepID=A0AAV6LMW0_9ERIC|nr:hypothetical protein RHGRI_001957 [Rhododendron griersonianum]